MSTKNQLINATPEVEAILKSLPNIETKEKGAIDTFDYRVQALNKAENNEVSMWHDIKLYPTPESKEMKICNMINEVMITVIPLPPSRHKLHASYLYMIHFLIDSSMQSKEV